MKRFVAVLLTVWILLSVLNVCGLSLDDGLVGFQCDETVFKLFSQESIATENGMIFGMTESDFKEYLISKNMLLYGAQKEGNLTFNVTKTNTDFSAQAQSFAGVSEKELLKFAEKLTTDPADVVYAGETPYIHIDYVDNTANTSFYVQQYITVHRGNLYALTINTPGIELGQEDRLSSAQILSGLTFKEPASASSGADTARYLLLAMLGAVIVALMVLVACSLWKVLKTKET